MASLFLPSQFSSLILLSPQAIVIFAIIFYCWNVCKRGKIHWLPCLACAVWLRAAEDYYKIKRQKWLLDSDQLAIDFFGVAEKESWIPPFLRYWLGKVSLHCPTISNQMEKEAKFNEWIYNVFAWNDSVLDMQYAC